MQIQNQPKNGPAWKQGLPVQRIQIYMQIQNQPEFVSGLI